VDSLEPARLAPLGSRLQQLRDKLEGEGLLR
jgi:hypothetical protein